MKNKILIGILVGAVIIAVAGGTEYYFYHQKQKKQELVKNEVLLINKDLDSGDISLAQKDIQKLDKNSIEYKNLTSKTDEIKSFNNKYKNIENEIKTQKFTDATKSIRELSNLGSLNSYEKQKIIGLKKTLSEAINVVNNDNFNSKVAIVQKDISNKNLKDSKNALNLLKKMDTKSIKNASNIISTLEKNINVLEKEENNKVNIKNIVQYFNNYYKEKGIELISQSEDNVSSLNELAGGNVSLENKTILNKLASEYPNKILYTLNQGPVEITINNKKAYLMVIENIQGYFSVVGNTPFLIIGADGHIYSAKEVGEAAANNKLTWNANIQVGAMGSFIDTIKKTLNGTNLQEGAKYFEKMSTTIMGDESYFSTLGIQNNTTINEIANRTNQVISPSQQTQSNTAGYENNGI